MFPHIVPADNILKHIYIWSCVENEFKNRMPLMVHHFFATQVIFIYNSIYFCKP